MTQEDKLIKQKMDELGTLSGGIVFGKEEAWEKLQTRLDKKRAKRIPVRYWLAAAAVLLFMCGVTALYKLPVKEMASKEPANTKEEMTPAVVTQESMTAQVENIPIQNPKPLIKQQHRHTKESTTVSVTLIQPTPPIQPIEQRKNDTIVIAKTTIPPTPARQPMKVVQINELYDNNKQAPQAMVANTSTPYLKNLPVVHVNDLNEYEQRRRMDRYPSRIWDNFAVNVPFLSPYERRTPNDYNDQDNTTHRSLKFKIN